MVLNWDGLPENYSWQWTLVTPIVLASGVDKLHVLHCIISCNKQMNKQKTNKNKMFSKVLIDLVVLQWDGLPENCSWQWALPIPIVLASGVHKLHIWLRIISFNKRTKKQTSRNKKFSRVLIDLVEISWRDGLPENCSWQWALVTPIVLASGVDKLHVWLRSGMQRQTSQSLSCPYLLPYQ